jgi:hypothetical protein
MTGVNTDVGEKFLHVHAAPNRVVAVPRGTPSEFRQPDRPGDFYQDQGRILLLRDFLIHWSCWGVDFGAAEQLFLKVVRVLRKQNHHSITFSTETWEDQQDDQDGWDKLGCVITFDCFIALPIYEGVPTRVALTNTPKIVTTVKLPADGSGETVVINEG